ncbi:hypothetical protein [Candidatus Frankia nodulisporulans]|uniref:hypothetical protein n=1 Tax=Candidatus Frankia nodulisporulans TaxID=2060052 RepID=UPI0013D67FE5|nr:hypothetical protein [Candidatus Frankia nodulisporulans]
MAAPSRGRRTRRGPVRTGGRPTVRFDHCDTVPRPVRPRLPRSPGEAEPPANGGTHHLLRKAVHNDEDTTGTVRCKKNVEKIDEMIIDEVVIDEVFLDPRSTRTLRVNR